MCEGDAKVIARTLQSREVEQPEYGHVLQDILVLKSTNFRVYNFTHVKCIGNSVAYFLARCSKPSNELEV